jgi:hypothetical protein
MEENKDIELNDGPQLMIIPEKRYYSCWGCKYYNFKMMQSGLHPIYRDSCKLLPEHIYSDINQSETPDNCPFLTQQKREDKINDITK